jgi:O-antigen/teichoic acid export membrane protein
MFFILNAVMVFFSYLNAAYKIYKVMLFENLIMSISVVIGFFVFSMFLNGIKVLLFSFLFSFVSRIGFILAFSKIDVSFNKVEFEKVKVFFKNTLLSSLMYFFSGLFISVTSFIILKLFNDKNFLGEFQVVIKSVFFALVAIFVFPINTFTFPEISKLISNKEFNEVKRIENKLIKYLGVFFIVLLILLPVTKYVISFVFPKEYENSYIYLNLMLPFLPFIAYTTFALNILKGFNRFDLALYVRIVGSLSFFVGELIFYGFGAKSVVFSMDLAFLTMAFVAYYFKRKLL